MPARLQTLRDDRVNAPRFQPARLVHGRRRSEDPGAGVAYPLQQRGRREAEVEADHGRAQFAHHIGHRVIERQPRRPGRLRTGIEAEFGVIAGKIAPATPVPCPRRARVAYG